MSQIKVDQITDEAGTGAPDFPNGIGVAGDLTIVDKIVHSGDTDTAIRFPAADTVSVETSGVERLRVDSSGLKTNAIVDANGGNTTTVNGIPLRPGVLDPENRIINGAFDFWQRGTSSTGSGYVAADRWVNNSNSIGVVTMSRQSFSLGDTFGSNNPTYFLRQTVSGQSASGDLASVNQLIEGVRSYAGQTITILGWARRSSGSGNMAVEPLQSFGTGGSPSSIVFVSPQTVTLTSSWTPFALTFAVPSISGKTLGTNNNDYFAFSFWTSAGSNFNARTNSLGLQTIGVDLWGIHIKVGTHTTEAVDLYHQPELGPELVRCQRYYEKSYNLDVAPGTLTSAGATVFAGSSDSANLCYCTIYYAVEKRVVPSLVGYRSNIAGTVNVWDYTRSGDIGGSGTVGAAVPFPGQKSGVLSVPVGAAFVPVAIYGHWVADAEI